MKATASLWLFNSDRPPPPQSRLVLQVYVVSDTSLGRCKSSSGESSLKHFFSWISCQSCMRFVRWPTSCVVLFISVTAERILTKCTRSENSASSSKVEFSGLSENKDVRPGLWLAEGFVTSRCSLRLLNRIWRNLIGIKNATSSTKFVFFFRADHEKRLLPGI